MLYKSYQHVERLGREEVEGILNGTCSIQIDFFALKKEIQNKVKEVLKDELF